MKWSCRLNGRHQFIIYPVYHDRYGYKFYWADILHCVSCGELRIGGPEHPWPGAR